MPYIKQKQRDRYKDNVSAIVDRLRKNGKDGIPNVGDVNYVVSKILYDIFDANQSYTLGNSLVGALECAKIEFYRRKLAPYEDGAIERNGDI